MSVVPELASILSAVEEPAALIRPDDMTVAAVNGAFLREFGAFGFEGRQCWQAMHRAKDCKKCGLECPLLLGPAELGEREVVQTLYESSRVTRVTLNMRPVVAAQAQTLYWLERIKIEKSAGYGRSARGLVGQSTAHRRLMRDIESNAMHDRPLLITGERGVGKQTVARSVHENSGRAARAFVSIPPELCRSSDIAEKLCGDGVVPGLFTRAAGGTIFIENALDVTPEVWRLIGSAARDGRVFLGAQSDPLPTSFRLIAASRTPYGENFAKGTAQKVAPWGSLFEDGIVVAPLNERLDDLSLLAEQFLRDFAGERGLRFSNEALSALRKRDWKDGNLADLARIVRQAAARAQAGVVGLGELNGGGKRRGVAAIEGLFLGRGDAVVPLEEAVKRYVRWAAGGYSGSREELAQTLGVSPRTLYRLLAQAGIGRTRK